MAIITLLKIFLIFKFQWDCHSNFEAGKKIRKQIMTIFETPPLCILQPGGKQELSPAFLLVSNAQHAPGHDLGHQAAPSSSSISPTHPTCIPHACHALATCHTASVLLLSSSLHPEPWRHAAQCLSAIRGRSLRVV